MAKTINIIITAGPARKQTLPPPFPTTGMVRTCLHFYREKTSVLFSLVDSHRIAPTDAAINRRSQQFTAFDFFSFCKYNYIQKPDPREILAPEPTLAFYVEFEGNGWDPIPIGDLLLPAIGIDGYFS